MIVNYSTECYYNGMQRLKHSLTVDEVMCFTEETLSVPSHEENPYAFKIIAIEAGRELDNDVLWLDASVYAVKDISPVWKWLKETGIFMEDSGHYVGDWCNEFTLDYFGITRKRAMRMRMFAAGYVGFDFTNNISIEFFQRWKQSMIDGCFKGSWENHRHDMTAGSIIANQMGIDIYYSEAGTYFAYIGDGYPKPKESAVFHLQGL